MSGPRARMTETELAAAVEAEVRTAVGGASWSALAGDRIEALRRYRGEPYGNEVEGRSQVVSRDTAEVVDGMMPSLMRVFGAGDTVAHFEPQGPEDEAAAEQASDYVNWIITQQNGGFLLFYVWFKDALLQRNGFVKSWWEESAGERQDYEGLTADQVEALSLDPALEVLVVEPADPGAPDPEARAPGLFDVRTRTRPHGRVRIANVPPEELVVHERAVSLDEAPFVAQRTLKTVSEMVAAGFDEALVAASALQGDVDGIESERAVRREPETGAFFLDTALAPADDSMRLVQVTEAYIRLDFDGDGIAELRKVVLAGNTVLLNEECTDGQPFSTLTPTPMPHKLYGKSLADDVADLQLVKTTLWRQMLDNLYLANDPEMVVSEMAVVDWDEWTQKRPGGIKRVKTGVGEATMPLATPFVAGASFPMVEYVDRVRAMRTGLAPNQGALDPNAISNVSATAATLQNDAAHAREELVARVFAETGVKHLCRRVLRLVSQHQDVPQTIRLRGRWVRMDPRGWNAGMDMTVSVGLGTGNRTQQMALMQSLIALDAEIVRMQGGADGPLVTARSVHAKLEELLKAAGYKAIDRFYQDPGGWRPAQPAPRPDPALAKAEAELRLARLKLDAEMQLKRYEIDQRAALERYRAGLEAELARQQRAAEALSGQETSPVRPGGEIG